MAQLGICQPGKDNMNKFDVKIEEWRPVVGFEGFYSVSNAGEIKRDLASRGFGGRAFAGKVMSQKKCANGYRGVSLYPESGKQRHLLVHRLVAIAFLGEMPKGYVVNHKDGNKANNNVSNLEWATPSENSKHAYRTGLARGLKGEDNPMSYLNNDTVKAIKILRGEGWNYSQIARAFNVDTGRIKKIVTGKLWGHIPCW